MHIPDNYLSPSTCATLFVAMTPIWYYSIRKINKTLSADKIPLIGIGGAFAFILMMFNLPIPDGTTAHAVGGTLIALLLGPYAACIAISVALFIQAIIFGDGGILSFGANCFNIAFILPFTGFFIYKILNKIHLSPFYHKCTIFLSAYISINLAAFFTALELGIQALFRSTALLSVSSLDINTCHGFISLDDCRHSRRFIYFIFISFYPQDISKYNL